MFTSLKVSFWYCQREGLFSHRICTQQ